jgi:diguanylate cyclase (GGDEF)-like protein
MELKKQPTASLANHTRLPMPGDGGQAYNDLSDIIQHGRIRTVFQPIISLKSAKVYGYEALSRITGPSVFKGPEELFQAAIQYNLAYKLERLCRTRALVRAYDLGVDKKIFLNICPSALELPDHERGVTAALIKELFHMRANVILEITEHRYIDDDRLFQKAVAYYRDQGFKIAIDDLGAGFAGLKMLAQIEPDIVKIDRFLISDIHRSTKKKLLLEAIVTFCHKINTKVVAEGIETKEELDVITGMKIDFGQGYYLAEPAEDLQHCSNEACERILELNINGFAKKQEGNFIGAIVDTVPPIEIRETVSSIIQLFKDDRHLFALPVVNDKDEGIPAGIIHKNRLFYKLGQQFGFALLSEKSAEHIMEKPLVFESDHLLEDVSLKSLERSGTHVYDAVVVVKNGIYIGIVHIHELLSKITEQKINMAIQANPLTGLPGNNIIKEEIITRLGRNQLFATLYFDLDNFKPFNDNYGFKKGDMVLRFLGNLLQEKIHEQDTEGFIGHIGGDDFVAVCRPLDMKILCEEILRLFDKGVKIFFDKETIKKGYYKSINRKGKIENLPLLSLSIGVVSSRDRAISSYGELASVASEVKKKAKQTHGSSYCIDLRARSKITSHLDAQIHPA